MNGMNIKEIRQITGLSQIKFASICNIPVRTIQKWESGERIPPNYVIELLEKNLFLNKQWKKENEMETFSTTMAKRNLVDSIWKSAGIEGLGTTFPDTKCILENIPVKTTKDEVYFIVNMKRAWEFLLNNCDYPANLMFLRELNKIAMDGLSYNAGEIRNIPVSIGGTSWIPEMPNSAVISEELSKINSMEDKLDAALEMFCYVARTQMFVDGNKRVAQLVTNKMMISEDIGIFSVPYDRIGEFTQKLVNFYESNDNTELKKFFYDYCLTLNPEYTKTDMPNDEKTNIEDDEGIPLPGED